MRATWTGATLLIAAMTVSATASAADLFAAQPIPRLLPEHLRCVGLGVPTKEVKGATQVQHWCEPLGNDILQVDLFARTASGDAGDYEVSWVNWSCSLPAPGPVKNMFCK